MRRKSAFQLSVWIQNLFWRVCPHQWGLGGEQKSSGVCGNKANGLVVFDALRVIPTCCETKPVFPRSRMRVVWPR